MKDRRGEVLTLPFTGDGFLGYHDSGDIIAGGDVEHDVHEGLLNNGPQSACTGPSCNSLVGDRPQGSLGKGQFHPVQLEEFLKLAGQSIARLGQNANQGFAVERVHGRNHWQTSDELWNKPKLVKVLWAHQAEGFGPLNDLARTRIIVESQRTSTDPLGDDVFQTGEGAPHDEQDVGGIDLDEVLLRMFASTLGRH